VVETVFFVFKNWEYIANQNNIGASVGRAVLLRRRLG
jgi:hypothetical protein